MAGHTWTRVPLFDRKLTPCSRLPERQRHVSLAYACRCGAFAYERRLGRKAIVQDPPMQLSWQDGTCGSPA